MKKTINLVYANFDKKTGISTVTINTPLGEFTGRSKMHLQDYQYPSSFAGCKYAEAKARIKYFKAKRRKIKTQLETMNQFYSTISQMKDFNPNDTNARKARWYIHHYESQLHEIEGILDFAKFNLKYNIQERDKFMEKMQKTKEKN